MDKVTYPTSDDWPTTAVDPGPGRLIGMGCGYSKYEPTGVHASYEFLTSYDCTWAGGPNTAGVGLETYGPPWASGGPVYDYWPGLHSTHGTSSLLDPIAEGQIDMTGLPDGQYVLKVISGNCNVLMTDFDPEVTTPVGDFAQPADNVPDTVEDTISFYWQAPVVGCTIPPVILSAESVLDHGGTEYGIDILTPPVAPAREMRGESFSGGSVVSPGPDKIEILFDMTVVPADGTLDTEVALSGTAGGTLDSLTPASSGGPNPNDMLIADVSGFTDRTCLTVTVSGMACTPNHQPSGVMPAPVVMDVVILAANCQDNDLQVNINDVLLIKGAWFQNANAGNFKIDCVTDGQVNINDVLAVKYNWFQSASCP
jgi:hypothetical protein